MIIAVYSAYDARTISANLGAPEYSYWFVRKPFTRLLEKFGLVVPVTDPSREVNSICRGAQSRELPTVLFSFEPPHKTVLGLACPTIPVFAWEFDTIPNEAWSGEPRNDWAYVLSSTGAAITHCQSSVAAVRRELGERYPIWSIPAPVHESSAAHFDTARGWQDGVELSISGGVAIDTAAVDLSFFDMRRAHGEGVQVLQALKKYLGAAERRPQSLTLSGVVYNTVLNPVDGRKNWADLIGGFVWAFRDNPMATLVVKITHHDVVDGLLNLLCHVAKLGKFKCRIIFIYGMLPEHEYRALIDGTSYTVNTSHGEGQCLPLMEYMSAGRPAVTPLHSAMLDYVSAQNSFVVQSTERPHAWPHDVRQPLRCMSHRISFADLVRAYRESFAVAHRDPRRYAAMSADAHRTLAGFCSDEVVAGKLSEVLEHLKKTAFAPPHSKGSAINAR